MLSIELARTLLRDVESREIAGRVTAVRGLSILVDRFRVPIGSLVRVEGRDERSGPAQHGEVIGFDGPRSVVMLYGDTSGIGPGDLVIAEGHSPSVRIGPSWLGRVIDGLGRPLDDGAPFEDAVLRPLRPAHINPLARSPIDRPIATGVRAIDGLLTIGRGQRMGIFAGPGVGKSTLLASIARHTSAQVNVIALVGERGREVSEFVQDTLGPEGLARSIVVVATGDESPLVRVRACLVACAAAEFFRDRGADVLLMVDSLTRLAQAQRQIGLAVGEQPATKGYTPSVFSLLPQVLERAGTVRDSGSITGLYTVLVEGDDLTEPVADAAKGILDGHVVLSRQLASRGHHPAIDVLQSISRVADRISDPHHVQARREMVRLLAAWGEHEELISIGAYARGSNTEVDMAILLREQFDAFLRQHHEDAADYPRTCRAMIELSGVIEAMRRQAASQSATSGNG